MQGTSLLFCESAAVLFAAAERLWLNQTMKVALLSDRIPPEGMGGAEVVVWRLARGLRAAGHDPRIITATERDSFEDTRDGIPTYHLHGAYPERFRAWLSLWNPQTAIPLRRLLRRLQPDVVNAHNIHYFLSYHALKIARETGSATVFSAHDVMPFAYGKLRHFVHDDIERIRLPQDYRLPRGYSLRHYRFRYNPWRNRIIHHYLTRYADRLTASSHALAQAFSANSLPAPQVAHTGIDPAEWGRRDEAVIGALRDQFNLNGRRTILIAGRLTPDKGTIPLLQAINRIKDCLPDICLLALTARDFEAQIPQELRYLRQDIRIAGWLVGDQLQAAFHLADVVAAPSLCLDTFPTVNLEAMAAGKPVIATCFGGSSEIVRDGETGFIVNPLDTSTFADRLKRLLSDAALRDEMGQNAQARIRESFTLEMYVDKMLQIYEQAISGNGAEH